MVNDQTPKTKPEAAYDLNRREWLLRLGELAALAGVSGIVPESASILLEAQASPQSLPPGLYDPSQDHLVHALSSAGTKFSPPAGSETDFVLPRAGPFQPQFLSGDEFRIVTRIVEIVLGSIDPAAKAEAAEWIDLHLQSSTSALRAAQHLDAAHREVAVAYYGEDVVRVLETADPQATARAGFRAVHELSVQEYGKPFLELDSMQQEAVVKSIGTRKSDDPAREWFDLLRREAIRGYYTSAGGLADLDYKGNAYYGECPGCPGK